MDFGPSMSKWKIIINHSMFSFLFVALWVICRLINSNLILFDSDAEEKEHKIIELISEHISPTAKKTGKTKNTFSIIISESQLIKTIEIVEN